MRVVSVAVAMFVVSLGSAAPQAAGQAAPPPQGMVSVGGDVGTPLTLSTADLKSMPRTTATLESHGTTSTYEGVLLGDVLKRAGVPLGHELMGKAVASYVLVIAADGYQALFALPELDPEFSDSQIVLADTVDGHLLNDTQGPFRVVAPHDKRAARSIRMVQKIDVVLRASRSA
jgi:DMSO/TMAO reductase YedYZ molybdopterin-dependent catalytic subunit